MIPYITTMARFGDIDGRSNRTEFWLYMLILFVILTAVQAAQPSTTVPITPLAVLIHLIPTTTVQMRRLHDTGRTGWWLLLGLTGVGAIPLLIWFCQPGRTDGDWTALGFVPIDRQEPRMDMAGSGQASVAPQRPNPQPSPTAFDRASDSWLLFLGSAACTVIGLLVAMSWPGWKDQASRFLPLASDFPTLSLSSTAGVTIVSAGTAKIRLTCLDHLRDGSPLPISVEIDGPSITLRFQHDGLTVHFEDGARGTFARLDDTITNPDLMMSTGMAIALMGHQENAEQFVTYSASQITFGAHTDSQLMKPSIIDRRDITLSYMRQTPTQCSVQPVDNQF